MIPDRENKIETIVNTMSTRIKEINKRYRKGPSLYFYKRITALRKQHSSIESFLSDEYALEILYATLVSWDMNSRGAKMKFFDDFKKSLRSAKRELCDVENYASTFDANSPKQMLTCLRQAFSKLTLMETEGRLVSNSKCLHFLFPSICSPMDRSNTLKYLYVNTNESENKFIEITDFSFEIMCETDNCRQFLDDLWNISLPKMIDNAILLLMNQSVE
jgi:hypothetical protein